MVKVTPYTYQNYTRDPIVFLPFCHSMACNFQVTYILRQVHRITLKGLLTLRGIPDTCYNYSRDPNFSPCRSMASRFRVATWHFQISALNDPKMTLNAKRSKLPHIHVKITHRSQVSLCNSFHFRCQPFCSCRTFWDKCTKWPPSDSEHYIMYSTESHISPPPLRSTIRRNHEKLESTLFNFSKQD